MINIINNKSNLVLDMSRSVSSLKSAKICKLDSLSTLQLATVVGLDTSNDLQGRLMGMGLTIGARVEVLQNGRFKPLLIGVGESRIAMGRDIAAMILVETGGDVQE